MSDQIKFSCLACGQQIVCDASESGRPMLCPSCNANLTVPRLMHQEPAGPVSDPAAPASPVTPPPITSTTLPEETAVAGSRTSGLAVASLICSLSSVITCVGWLPGIICGHLAKARIRRDPGLKGRGLATAGLFIGYAIIITSCGLAALFVFRGVSVFNNAFHQAEQIMATNKIVVVQGQSPSETASNTDEQTQASPDQPAASGWTMDVKGAQIPDSPVTGQVHGQNFEIKKAIFHAGNLRFTSANGAEYVLIRGLGADIANNSFEEEPDSTADAPKVEIAWGENGQNNTQSFDSSYAMELKFDAAQKRKVHGHIYLCLPDDAHSYLAGAFTVTLPKPKKPQANAQ